MHKSSVGQHEKNGRTWKRRYDYKDNIKVKEIKCAFVLTFVTLGKDPVSGSCSKNINEPSCLIK